LSKEKQISDWSLSQLLASLHEDIQQPASAHRLPRMRARTRARGISAK
jgi:hypothetical protein